QTDEMGVRSDAVRIPGNRPGPPGTTGGVSQDMFFRRALVDADLGLPVSVPSTALFTDHYELTMLQAALKARTAGRRSVFEVFARRLPDGRRYGVVCGTGRVLDAVENFRFDEDVLRFLHRRGVVDDTTLEWL